MKINQNILNHAIRIKLNLLEAKPVNKPKSLLITSAYSREGTTTLVAILGYAMALSASQRVLLIDANLRNPCLHKLFNLENINGFCEFITSRYSLDECISDSSVDGLKIMTSGPVTEDIFSVLSNITSSKKEMIEKDFNWIIYDTAPLIDYPDTLFYRKLADSFIFNVRANKTKCESAIKALESIRNEYFQQIGTVLNMCTGSLL